MLCGIGGVFQVQEVIQASQVLLDSQETEEMREIVDCLVFLDFLMVIPQQCMFNSLTLEGVLTDTGSQWGKLLC